ncbi:MAG: hypothetical protein IT450_08220 [Phycisphaerales bacterium]|nr:hypothetical protein [Phycisphaerales bacterium]
MWSVIVVLDSNRRIASVQQSNAVGLEGTPFLECVHPLDRPAVETLLRGQDHGVCCADRVMLRVHGRFEWCTIRAARLPDRGVLVHVEPAIRDLEERRLAAIVNESIQREQELDRLIPVLRNFTAPELEAIRRELLPLTPAEKTRPRRSRANVNSGEGHVPAIGRAEGPPTEATEAERTACDA